MAKIFQEMQGNYGSRFLNQWKTGQQASDGADLGVKNAMAIWGRKLAGFSDYPEAIGAVLAALPDEPPSLPQFINLCRDAARRLNESAPRLVHQQTPEERERADQAAKEIAKAVTTDRRNHKAWAEGLKKRHEDGENLTPLQIDSYREALGISNTPEALAA